MKGGKEKMWHKWTRLDAGIENEGTEKEWEYGKMRRWGADGKETIVKGREDGDGINNGKDATEEEENRDGWVVKALDMKCGLI